jgi:hypothetical protein
MTAEHPREKQRCQAQTRAGRPCRAWALRALPPDSPPLCRAHAPQPPAVAPRAEEAQPGGLYALHFCPEEVAALQAALQEADASAPLAGEVDTARIMLRRLLGHLARLGEPSTGELVALAPLVLGATRTIAHLLKDERVLQEAGEDPLQAAISAALDALGEEWGVEL